MPGIVMSTAGRRDGWNDGLGHGRNGGKGYARAGRRDGWNDGLRHGRNGGQGYGRNNARRNDNDFFTFFFSNFPHGYGESDMVKIFQKWTRVKEIFISRRLNKWGRRFCFVRFLDVKNVRRLEGELDHIFIGNRKLHVNIPKY